MSASVPAPESDCPNQPSGCRSPNACVQAGDCLHPESVPAPEARVGVTGSSATPHEARLREIMDEYDHVCERGGRQYAAANMARAFARVEVDRDDALAALAAARALLEQTREALRAAERVIECYERIEYRLPVRNFDEVLHEYATTRAALAAADPAPEHEAHDLAYRLAHWQLTDDEREEYEQRLRQLRSYPVPTSEPLPTTADPDAT